MGKIVITSWGSFGDVNPYVGLALGLRARGHHPVLAMPAHYRGVVEREGLAFHPVRPDVDSNATDVVGRIMDVRNGAEYLFRELLMPHLRHAYEDVSAATADADLIVTHPVTFGAQILAEKRGMPWLSSVLAPMSFFSVHDMPVFPPAPFFKRLQRVPGAARALVGMVRRVTRTWSEPVRRFRAQLGLPPGGDPIYEGQFSPQGTIAMFSRLLAEPQPDWPPDTRVTGQVFFDRPGGAAMPPELEAFLAAGPPPVVFTLGTSAVAAAGGFYRESAEAVRRLGMRAVLLVGRDPRNRPAGPLPEGVIAVEFAPHSAVFPRAAAVVHQGGAGTLGQALRSGRPMLVVPWAHDQPDNAHRAARLGVARTLYPRRYTAPRVAKHLQALLEDAGYANRAAEVGEIVRAEDGVANACEVIEARMKAG